MTKTNPRQRVLAKDVKHKGASVFSDNGELNASSKKDAIQVLSTVMQQLSSGVEIQTTEEATVQEQKTKARAARREALAAIIADTTGDMARQVGMEMAGTINESVARQGLARQVLQYSELSQGERPEIYVQDKNVIASVLTGPTQARLQVVRDNLIMPPEVDITSRMVIEGRQINVSREDLLQRKFDEGLEAVLVGEDRMFKTAADTLIENNGMKTIHAGSGVTTGVLESGISMINGYNLPLAGILFSGNLWANVSTSKEFENLFDPVTRLEIIRTGRVGTLYGASVMTDGTREPRLRVLDGNEIYYFSMPEFLGEFTDRGGVQSLPLTAAETGVNGAGWHMTEYFSLALVNYRAIAKTRIS